MIKVCFSVLFGRKMTSSIATSSFVQDTGIVTFEGVQLSVTVVLNC